MRDCIATTHSLIHCWPVRKNNAYGFKFKFKSALHFSILSISYLTTVQSCFKPKLLLQQYKYISFKFFATCFENQLTSNVQHIKWHLLLYEWLIQLYLSLLWSRWCALKTQTCLHLHKSNFKTAGEQRPTPCLINTYLDHSCYLKWFIYCRHWCYAKHLNIVYCILMFNISFVSYSWYCPSLFMWAIHRLCILNSVFQKICLIKNICN